MNHEAFLLAIRESPDDDTPRLAYADWLEVDGNAAQAEYIRLQCVLARLTAEDERRSELYDRARELETAGLDCWFGPLFDAAFATYTFGRGFVNRMNVSAEQLLRPEAEAAFAHMAMVSDLEIMGISQCPEVLTSPLLARLLPRLTRLTVARESIRDAIMAALASNPMPKLVRLNLEDNRIGPVGAEALAQSLPRASLITLDLRDNVLGAGGASVLASVPSLRNLDELTLTANVIGDKGAQALAASPHLSHVTRLLLGRNEIGDSGARALANSPYLTRLTGLSLGLNWLTDAGARALASSPYLTRLTDLVLSHNRIGNVGRRRWRVRQAWRDLSFAV